MEIKTKDNKLLVSNMFSSGVFQLLMLIVPIITTPYISRIFSPSDIGVYATSLGFASIFVTISSFGIPILGAREIAKTSKIGQRSKVFFSIWRIQVLVAFLCFGLFLILCNFQTNKEIFFIQSVLIIASIFDVSWFFVGIEEIKKNIFRNFLTKFVATILIFTTIKTNNQLILYTAINVGASLLGNLSMFVQLPKYISRREVKFVKRIDSTLIPNMFLLMIPMLLDTFKSSVSKIILNNQVNNFEVGLYEQGIKIIIICLGIISSMSNAVVPRMSYLVSDGFSEKLGEYFEKFSELIFYFSILVIIGIFAVGEFFVPFFFGPGYEGVLPILLIGSFSIMFSSLNVFMMNGLIIPLSKDSNLLKSSLLSASSVVLLNFLLDSILKANGAAISFTLSSIVLFIMYLYILRDSINYRLLLIRLLKTLLFIAFSIVLIFRLKKIFIFVGNMKGFIFYSVLTIIISCSHYLYMYIKKYGFRKVR